MKGDESYYRWVLINNQETCYLRVVKLLDGMFKTEQDAEEFYKDSYCFKEHLFTVMKLDFSETPYWLAVKTGEILD